METNADPTGPEESHTLQVTVVSTGMFRVWTNLTVRVKSMIVTALILKAALVKEMLL